MPSHIFETMGLWVILPGEMPQRFKDEGLHFMGGIHAVEHASIALFPLFALCDRNDVGGICYPNHPQLEKPAIFIYDGYPGGVGLADYGYGVVEELLRKTLEMIRDCPCQDGCPSCVHSPKCGSGNKPLDKRAAEFVLEWLLGESEIARKGKRKGKDEVITPPPEILERDSELKEPETVASAPTPAWLKEELARHRILFLDVETQRGAEEVGGWHNKHLMRVAAAVVYDSLEDAFLAFEEDRVHELIEKLKTGELIVGFNIADFDYQVLKAYTSFRFQQLRTFDLLQEVSRQLGYRLSLGHLAHKTLNAEKSADGLQSLQWFKEGRIEEVIAYCKKDVEITKDLFLFGLAHGYLLFETRAGQRVRLPVGWKLEKILKGAVI
jgi:DEAD/DEAH box helicase domain-containing protein